MEHTIAMTFRRVEIKRSCLSSVLKFSNDEEHTKAERATWSKERKNFRKELQEHLVNAVEGSSKPVVPNQKAKQNTTKT